MGVVNCPEAVRRWAQIRVFRGIAATAEEEARLRFSAPGSGAHIRSARKAATKSFTCAHLVGLPSYRVENANRYGTNRARRELGLRPLPSPRQAKLHQR